MIAKSALCAAALLLATGFGRAQAAPGPTATTLSLSVSGNAAHAPDAMTATLEGTATDSDPAKAQANLNAMMAKALASARKTGSVTATTGSYSVQQITEHQNGGKQTAWRARQVLNLRLAAAPDSSQAKAFLAMIGTLQTQGVLLQTLAGALSPEAAQKTETAAIRNAVHRLHIRAGALAAALGDRVGRIRHVSLDVATPVRPVFRMMAVAAPAPVAAPGDVTERASLQATIDLLPSSPAPKRH